jgi:hypothetical protein
MTARQPTAVTSTAEAPSPAATALAGFLPPVPPTAIAHAAWEYGLDAWQRSILFLDILRQRGNETAEHERGGMPPVLVFDYEVLIDGRDLPTPVNYALVRIVPPEGQPTDPAKRPFVVMDPRAGTVPASAGSSPTARLATPCAVGIRVTSSRSSAILARGRRSRTSRVPKACSCRRSPSATPMRPASHSSSATVRRAGRC